jgi:hypothetical protein
VGGGKAAVLCRCHGRIVNFEHSFLGRRAGCLRCTARKKKSYLQSECVSTKGWGCSVGEDGSDRADCLSCFARVRFRERRMLLTVPERGNAETSPKVCSSICAGVDLGGMVGSFLCL